MFAAITSGAILGIHSYLVQVEVNASGGLPCFSMVGYLAGEVKEAGERVRVALRNTGISLPPLHITVNLSPAHVRKEGTAYDLPIAVGVLTAIGIIKEGAADKMLIIGELGLDGAVKGVAGILPIVREAVEQGISRFLVPKENEREAAVIPQARVCGVGSLQEVMAYLLSEEEERQRMIPFVRLDPEAVFAIDSREYPDFGDIAGQEPVKRAVLIAAAGFHHLLLIGPPGCGKTMIAKRIPSILPPFSLEESLEVSSIYSISGMLEKEHVILTRRPFLHPHHTITEQALTGGGKVPRPGVVSLAHRGVLFLDELPECKRSVVEILRQPIEDKTVSISRTQGNYTYPADFMFVGAMNPCPCGYFPDEQKCSCTGYEVHRYLNRISGPIMDRIDVFTEVSREDISILHKDFGGTTSEKMRRQVESAREIQSARYQGSIYRCNGDVRGRDVHTYCPLGAGETKLMEEVFRTMDLSARAYHRILKVARTIADLAASEKIREEHLLEAIHYRMNDSRYWR